MEEDENVSNIQDLIEEILGCKVGIRRKKISNEGFDKHFFIKIIDNIDYVFNRSFLVEADLGINLKGYDEPFFETIDMLLEMNYNKDQMEVVNFFLYGRFNADGTINSLVDEENGDVVILDTAEDLWNVLEDLKIKK